MHQTRQMSYNTKEKPIYSCTKQIRGAFKKFVA